MVGDEARIGSFQVALLFLLGVNYVIVSLNHALPTFQNYTPDYYCKVEGVEENTYGCVSTDTVATNTTPASGTGIEYSSCAGGYQFDSDRGEISIVTEWGLVCEKRFLSPLNTTLYFLGVLIGAWSTGILTDRVGRLPVLAMCLYIQGALSVALYLVQDYLVFLGVRALQGVFVQGLQTSSYMLLVELFPVKTRTLVGVTLAVAWAIGLAILAGLCYAIPNWRVLQLAISVPTAVTVLYIWIIPESPRWLLAKGRISEANIVLRRIAKYNSYCCSNSTSSHEPDLTVAGTTVNETITPVNLTRKSCISNADFNETRDGGVALGEATILLTESFDQNAERNEENQQDKVKGMRELKKGEASPRDTGEVNEANDDDVEKSSGKETDQGFIELLRHKTLRTNTLIMILVWFSVSISYYGIMFHLPNLGGDRHSSFAIGAGLEVVSYVVAYFVLSRYGRRIPLSIYLLLSGSICIVVSAISIPILEKTVWSGPTKITLVLIGKSCIVSCFAVIYLYTVEIFPTVLRGAGLGYCGIAARIGSLAAPQLLLLGEYTSMIMPVTVMGVLCLVSGIGSLALPETLNKPLPDTIEEAEELGRKRTKSKFGEVPLDEQSILIQQTMKKEDNKIPTVI